MTIDFSVSLVDYSKIDFSKVDPSDVLSFDFSATDINSFTIYKNDYADHYYVILVTSAYAQIRDFSSKYDLISFFRYCMEAHNYDN